MRLIHRDRTETEKKELKKTEDMIRNLTIALKKGEIEPSSLPGISALLKALGVNNDEDESSF